MARAEGYYSFYQLDRDALEAAARELFSSEQMTAAAEDMDLNDYDRKVRADYSLPDGRLKEIPAQRRKQEVVLRYVVKVFEQGVKYGGKQVNETLWPASTLYNGFFAGKPGLRGYWGGVAATLSTTTK